MRRAVLDATINPASRSRSVSPPTHVEEQRALRDETIHAFHSSLNDQEDLLIPREKTEDEIQAEERAYRAFLEREVGGDLRDVVVVDDRVGPESEGKKEKVKEKEKGKGKGKGKGKEETDQEFLIKCLSFSSSLPSFFDL